MQWLLPCSSPSSVPSRNIRGAEASPPRVRYFLTAALLAAGTGTAVAEPLRLVAMGDFPYEEPRDFPRFERLIAAINRQPPALVVHIGDINPGPSPRSEAPYRRIRNYFAVIAALDTPTPAEHNSTDCPP